MTKEEIVTIVKSYINDCITLGVVENPKIDFKSSWYDMKNKFGKYEFLKDTSAIANTMGRDGYIIIGFDEKTKKYTNSTFNDSKLADESELHGIITKICTFPFQLSCYDIEIDGNNLSVLHIPPSFDKPHVLRSYMTKNKKDEHRTFVRRGTTTRIATRDDIENMYYDRKNILPEYAFDVYIPLIGLNLQWKINENKFLITTGLTIENYGRRPIAIRDIVYEIRYKDDSVLAAQGYVNKEKHTGNSHIAVSNLVIQTNSIENWSYLEFFYRAKSDIHDKYYSDLGNIKEIEVALMLTNGKEIKKLAFIR